MIGDFLVTAVSSAEHSGEGADEYLHEMHIHGKYSHQLSTRCGWLWRTCPRSERTVQRVSSACQWIFGWDCMDSVYMCVHRERN